MARKAKTTKKKVNDRTRLPEGMTRYEPPPVIPWKDECGECKAPQPSLYRWHGRIKCRKCGRSVVAETVRS